MIIKLNNNIILCYYLNIGIGQTRLSRFLDTSKFTSLDHAREKIAAWAWDYNTQRPHSSLGYATPAAFAAELKKQGAA